LVPFQVSVLAIAGGPPPAANAAVDVPALPKFCLAVFKSFTSEKEEPL